jgi:hypothetical protein
MAEDKPKSLAHKRSVQKMSPKQLRDCIEAGTLMSAAARYELLTVRKLPLEDEQEKRSSRKKAA